MAETIYEALAGQGPSPGIVLKPWRAGDHKVLCPTCSHSRKNKNDPCLSVTVTEEGADAKAVWKCHNCSWSGWVGVGKYARVKDAARKVYRRPEVKPVPPQKAVVEYLASRGIPSWLVEQEGIWGAKVWMPKAGERVPVVAFPFKRDGQIVNVKYRDPVRKDFRQEKDAEPVPYGLDDIVGAEEIVICEGEIDRLSIKLVGKRVISVPDGAPGPRRDGSWPDLSESAKFDWFEAAHSHIEKAERVIIATDADVPGRILAQELIRRCGRQKCWRVEWPAGVNDANALHMQQGEEALLAALDQARAVPVEGEVTVLDAWEDVEAAHMGGEIEWFSTGYPMVDPIYRVLRRQITVVTGMPNEGKSNFLDQIMVNMALNLGWKFGIFSPETPVDKHVINLLEKAARAPFYAGPTPRMPLETARAFRPFLDSHFHFLRWERKPGMGPKRRCTVDWIDAQIDYLVRRYGINGFVLDPYNRVQRTGTDSEPDFVLDLLDGMQANARRNNIHIWIVAHPAKQFRDRNGKRPDKLTLQDVSGAAHWDNATDMGLLVRRIWTAPDGTSYQPRDTPTEVECLKSRDRHSGQKGASVRFKYRWSDGVFLPLQGHDGAYYGPDGQPGGDPDF